MKISKLFAITLQSKSGLVFFAVLSAYNLLLGVYLKDFFVLTNSETKSAESDQTVTLGGVFIVES